MKGKLPKFMATGSAKQARRQVPGVKPAKTPKAVIDSLIPIKPVLPPPKMTGVPTASKVAPALAPSRLTAVRAVQAQRDKGRVRAKEAGRKEEARMIGRERRAVKNAGMAIQTRLTRQNPASPQADLVTGRLRYSGAFSSTAFKAPFQKSYNSRRSYGA